MCVTRTNERPIHLKSTLRIFILRYADYTEISVCLSPFHSLSSTYRSAEFHSLTHTNAESFFILFFLLPRAHTPSKNLWRQPSGRRTVVRGRRGYKCALNSHWNYLLSRETGFNGCGVGPKWRSAGGGVCQPVNHSLDCPCVFCTVEFIL